MLAVPAVLLPCLLPVLPHPAIPYSIPQIQQAIHGNLQKHTVLIIAHRLSTVEKAHSIIVLDKGRVVQRGTHKQLLAQGGLYAKLVQRQILGLETGTDDDSGGGGGSWQETMRHKEPPDGHGEVHKA